MAERLRRLTRNQIPSGSVGSNPTDRELFSIFFNAKVFKITFKKYIFILSLSLVSHFIDVSRKSILFLLYQHIFSFFPFFSLSLCYLFNSVISVCLLAFVFSILFCLTIYHFVYFSNLCLSVCLSVCLSF